jgi:hypothetical protein
MSTNEMTNVIAGLLGEFKSNDYESMSQDELLGLISNIDEYLNDESYIANEFVLLEAENMKNEIRKFIK